MKKILLAMVVLLGFGLSSASAQEYYYVNCWKCNGLKYTSTKCSSCNGRGGNERYTYRDCRACKGTGYIKELGGYIDNEPYYNNRRCEYCNGTGKEKAGVEWIRCTSCNGTGEHRTPCSACNGTGSIRKKRE